jgi:polyphosphate kinase
VLNPIGHGHYSGKDGKLYTDISTLTTAKNIAEKLTIRFK